MHDHIASKRNGEIVAQSFFTESGSQVQRIALLKFLVADLVGEITAVQHFEEQFVALFAILTHQRLKGFHRRRLNLLEAIKGIDISDGIKYIVALRHLYG